MSVDSLTHSTPPIVIQSNNWGLHKLFCALLSTDNMYDSYMMSIFTREAVQNVLADFRTHLN